MYRVRIPYPQVQKKKKEKEREVRNSKGPYNMQNEIKVK